jgi:blue copper oxidase
VTAPQHRKISRRTLLVGGAAGAALAGLGRFDLLVPGATAQSTAAVRNPLFVPPTVAITSGTVHALIAKPSILDLGGGHSSSGLGYRSPQSVPQTPDGTMPGPTFVAAVGDDVRITLRNRLTEDTTVHWHGMLVAPAQDGQPHDHVAAGTNKAYRFRVLARQRPAFNWYHPHPHGRVSPQVAMGLAGGFVVADPTESSLGLPVADAYDVALVVRDAQFDSRGRLQYKPSSNGYLGSTPLVNGTKEPVLDVDRALYRLRILNGAPARVFRLAWGDGRPLLLTGNDGGLLARPASVPEVMLGPAERVEVVLDLRGAAAGSTVMLRDLAMGWDLLQLRVAGPVVANGQGWDPNAALSTITPLTRATVDREFSFDGMSRINGRIYDLHRIDFQVPFRTVERWRFTTGGNAPHPVHVHGGHFQVVRRVGKGARNTIQPWETGWKDTVLLQKGETVEVNVRFDAYRGRYLMHCHQLEHEDSGMMANFEVV